MTAFKIYNNEKEAQWEVTPITNDKDRSDILIVPYGSACTYRGASEEIAVYEVSGTTDPMVIIRSIAQGEA